MKFALLLGLALPCMGQIGMAFPGPGMVHSAAAPAFSVVQFKMARCSDGSSIMVCENIGNTGTLTIPSTVAGHAAIVMVSYAFGPADILSSVSGGGTWTVSSASHIRNVCCGDMSAAYVTGLAGGTTSLVLTWAAGNAINTPDTSVYYAELAGPTAFDTANGVLNNSGTTTQTGAPLTLAGSGEAVAQMCTVGTNNMASAASPYDTNFLNHDSGSGVLIAWSGASVAITSSGAGASFTSGSSSSSTCTSIALK